MISSKNCVYIRNKSDMSLPKKKKKRNKSDMCYGTYLRLKLDRKMVGKSSWKSGARAK
jgi:hypothetical protein